MTETTTSGDFAYVMANTYSSLFYHLVFSTKNRQTLITADIENRVWSYVGGIARHHKLKAIEVGGFDDHLHALIMSPPANSPSQIVKWLKTESTKWIKSEFPLLRGFSWQDGFGAFTVSKSKIDDVVRYIKNQRDYHSRETFEDEYLQLMKLHEVDFDPKYLFD